MSVGSAIPSSNRAGNHTESGLWLGLTQVRHGIARKPPNPFKMSSGDRRVCTTFGKRLQPLRKAETELVKQGFLFSRRFRDPAEADLTPIGRWEDDVGALQCGQQSQRLHR